MSKIQIRQGVFETNSSSTHSISIYSTSDITIPTSLTVVSGEFGWEHCIYDDTVNKLSYLWEAMKAKYLNSFYPTKQDVEVAYCNCKKMLIDALHRIGVENVEFKESFDVEKWGDGKWSMPFIGYIDHSNELGDGFILPILKSDDILINFLFNKNSIIETGNDNDDDYDIDDNFDNKSQEDLLFDYYKGN